LTLLNGLNLNAHDRHLAALPLFHITGLGLSLTMIMAGGANVVAEGFDPAAACEMIDAHGVTLMASFPPVLSLLLGAKEESGAQWDSLRYVLGLDSPDVIQELMAETTADFWTGFGQSETSGVVTLGSVRERPGSAGRPIPFAQVDCVLEDGEPAPIGQEGEIVVRGPVVFQGYWGDPDATAFAFRGGLHHTGDLGKFDADGYLYYVGRKPEKELIKSGGENIYPAEVEHVISGLPGVAAVCVIGVPDETWGEAVKAVIELKPGAALTVAQIQEAVAEAIAAFKKPRQVEFVDSLPRDGEGGVDREAVKRDYGVSG
jgi:long-chain acyl-CoA synthetase